MPKETFFNLPEEKRALILDVAIQEFRAYGYDSASISRMVDDAGIAKGSFYQYFDSKKDLFRYIIQCAGEEKLAYLDTVVGEGEGDVLNHLRDLYRGALRFLREHPALADIADEFVKNSNPAFREDILGVSVEQSNAFTRKIVEDGVQRSDLRTDIDANYVAHLLTSISIALGDYFRSLSRDSGMSDQETYEYLADQTVDFIRRGIQANGSSSETPRDDDSSHDQL